MVISAIAFAGNVDALLYPIVISAVGIPISLATILMVRVNSEEQVGPALKKMLIISSVLMAVVMYFVTGMLLPATFEMTGIECSALDVYYCFLAGLIAGLVVGLLTEYYTAHDYQPVREVAQSCETGSATNIIFGLALGYKSSVGPYLAIGLAIYIPWMLAGMYGVAIASLGMLGTLVIALTITRRRDRIMPCTLVGNLDRPTFSAQIRGEQCGPQTRPGLAVGMVGIQPQQMIIAVASREKALRIRISRDQRQRMGFG